MKVAGKAGQIKLYFLGPVVGAGGWQAERCICSWFPAVSRQWCSTQQLTEPATAGGLLRPCALLDSHAQQSGLPPFYSKHSVVAGLATAIAADSRSLHSQHLVVLGTVGKITWFETACSNNQSQASAQHLYCNCDWWMIMQRHATSLLIPRQIWPRTLLVTHLIISYNYLLLRKNALPNLKWTRHCTLLQSIRIYKVYNSRLNGWFWYFSHCSLQFRFMY